MRILIRHSKTAIWARRVGSLAVPLLVLSVLMHRFGLMSTFVFQITAVVTALVCFGAVLLGSLAIVRLWFSGDHGWRNALWGLFWGSICLLPFVWHVQLAVRYPHVTDVSTSSVSVLPLLFEPDTALMAPAKELTRAQLTQAFPDVLPRAYPVAPEELHELVMRLIAEEGWDVRFEQLPSGAAAGRINARIVTLVGWREEAVFAIEPTAIGAKIDMRSASIGALHDFGSNGNRITRFLAQLDAEVTDFLRDMPNSAATASADEDQTPDVETGDI